MGSWSEAEARAYLEEYAEHTEVVCEGWSWGSNGDLNAGDWFHRVHGRCVVGGYLQDVLEAGPPRAATAAEAAQFARMDPGDLSEMFVDEDGVWWLVPSDVLEEDVCAECEQPIAEHPAG